MPDPFVIGAGMNFLGNLIGGANEEPQQNSYYRVGSQPQLALFNRIMQAAGNGSGEFGFGQAAGQGMASLRQNMLNRGINANSGVYNSALAQMFANATGQDAGNRRNFAMQAAQMQPWTANATNYMDTPFTNAGGSSPNGQAANAAQARQQRIQNGQGNAFSNLRQFYQGAR